MLIEKEEKSSIWKRIGNGIVNFFKSIGNWFKNLFSKKEEVEEAKERYEYMLNNMIDE